MPDNKRIGVLTLHRSNNYGAVLQAYALSKFLKDAGHSPFIINYKIEPTTVGTYLKHPFKFLAKIAEKKVLSSRFLRSKISDQAGKTAEKAFFKIFEEFRESYLNITPQAQTFESLKEDPPSADAYIVGSDQVWATDFVFSSTAFLLSFAPAGVKKISYAASFGKSELERYLQSAFRLHIKDFDAISVREKSGLNIVRNLSNADVTHVIDPTLLLTDYTEIIDYSLVPDFEYMLSYRLGQASDLNIWMNDTVDSIATFKNVRHFSVSTNSPKGAITSGETLQPTPGQLLGLIDRATFFATNSFHGSVFAILMRTDFLTFARDSAPDKQNLRLTELLSNLGLIERFCEPFTEKELIFEKLKNPCDFDSAFSSLAHYRGVSVDFLKRSLKE